MGKERDRKASSFEDFGATALVQHTHTSMNSAPFFLSSRTLPISSPTRTAATGCPPHSPSSRASSHTLNDAVGALGLGEDAASDARRKSRRSSVRVCARTRCGPALCAAGGSCVSRELKKKKTSVR